MVCFSFCNQVRSFHSDAWNGPDPSCSSAGKLSPHFWSVLVDHSWTHQFCPPKENNTNSIVRIIHSGRPFLPRHGNEGGRKPDLWVNFLQGAEKGDEGRAAKVGDGPQAGEEAAVPHFLKVPLAHVLHARCKHKDREIIFLSHSQGGSEDTSILPKDTLTCKLEERYCL